VAGGGEHGFGGFGASVALAADGRTALIGGSEAAWIYERSGSAWSHRRERLAGSGEVPGGTFAGGKFGYSVALSADAQTALVGGPGDDKERGAAWAFARSTGARVD
jgi:hypothetical protein